MRRPILYGISGGVIGAAAATTVGALVALSWVLFLDLRSVPDWPTRDRLEHWLMGADIVLVVAVIAWAAFCGVYLARRSDTPPRPSRKEIIAVTSWWVVVLVPAFVIGLLLVLQTRQQRLQAEGVELSKQIAHRSNRITDTRASFTPDGKSIVLELTFDGPRAGAYALTAYAHDCGTGNLEIKQTLQLPAGKSHQSFTFSGTGDWKHGKYRGGPEVHVWDEQVVGRITLEPQFSAAEAEALRRAGLENLPWWISDFDYRSPPLNVRCSDEIASATPPAKQK